MSTKIVMSPGKYIQGKGELSKLCTYTKPLGDSPFIIADTFVTQLTQATLLESYSSNQSTYTAALFGGECSKEEINRLQNIAAQNNCNVIVGIGGGKTLDTAKSIAFYMHLPVVVVPTIASTDAPCSALSVLYTPDGVFDQYLMLPSNPSVVLMDTQIIANAPARLLVSGMGDALATYFEARACKNSHAITMSGGQSTQAAFALAELCYKTLLSEGLKAKLAVDSKVCTESVDHIIEANTYLSGIGFESGGLAAAHAIHNGLTVLTECHHLYHGEKVAFGTLAQLALENAPLQEIEDIVLFCKSIGLPTTLEDMGAGNVTPEQLMAVAKASTVASETIHNMPTKVTAEDVYAAILTADKLGHYFNSL